MIKIEVKIPNDIAKKHGIKNEFYAIRFDEEISSQSELKCYEWEWERKEYSNSIVFTVEDKRWKETNTYAYNPIAGILRKKQGDEYCWTDGGIGMAKPLQDIKPYFTEALKALHEKGVKERSAEWDKCNELSEKIDKDDFLIVSSHTTQCACGGTRIRVRTKYGYEEWGNDACIYTTFGLYCSKCGKLTHTREVVPVNIPMSAEDYWKGIEKE